MPEPDAMLPLEAGREARAVELVELFRSHRKPRTLTGILLLGTRHLGSETELAARLSVEPLDYAARLLAELPSETNFVNINAGSEKARLERIAEETGKYDCVLVVNFDLALAKLDADERARLWHGLLRHFPYHKRALLLALPANAEPLWPEPEAYELWVDEGRIAKEM